MNLANQSVEEGMDFRFGSRKEYEEEMKRVISLKNSPRKLKGADPEELEEIYEVLVEEYLSFCASEEDGQ